MKPQEIVLASGLVALVAGAGSALAVRAFVDAPARAESGPRVPGEPRTDAGASTALDETERHALDGLRLADTALLERIASLEARITELSSTRTAVAPADAEPTAAPTADLGTELEATDDVVLTPAFVASVDAALARIEEREDAERAVRQKELQAQRVEERVMRLQEQLGLNNRQSSDMRTALLGQEEKREALFQRMREAEGDPRDARDGFRTIRDETHATLSAFLTPEQMRLYTESEESEWGRRGDFGGGRPPGDAPRRDGAR